MHERNNPDLKVSSATFNGWKFEWIYFPSLSQNSLLRFKCMKFILSVFNIYQIHYNNRSFLVLVVDCHISIIVSGAAIFTSGECRPRDRRYCDKTSAATRKTIIVRWSLYIFLNIGVLGVELYRFLVHYMDLTAQIGLESTGVNKDARPYLSTSICMDSNIAKATQTRLHFFYFEMVAKNVYGRYHDLVDHYEISISLMTIDLLFFT